jgi:regulator of RNase E activity RraA
VTCGGVPIRTGDLVVGDADGVVVIHAHGELDVLELAEERERSEEATRQEILSGRTLIDVRGLNDPIRTLGYV